MFSDRVWFNTQTARISWPFFSVVLSIKVRESLAGLSLQVMESVAACPKVHYFQVAPRRIRKLLFL